MNSENTGYAVSSASGRTLKLYVDGKFVGLLSFADIEKAKKSRIFVATIFKFVEDTLPRRSNEPLEQPLMPIAQPEKLSLNLCEVRE